MIACGSNDTAVAKRLAAANHRSNDPNARILDRAGQWVVDVEAFRGKRARFDTLIHLGS